ncbi:energy-coupling factor transport system permease protein [Agromyces flavus]|uniref:Energy-coupling factor transport system permease protein n=1 Tax=Agromyces flavus TaxID=589382 RepID=A0A1H1Q9N3_9MICO|nr:energy-coupling factor transporter transmembrane component T [Agromyces flavus]MCP2367778.1 energy-coupling factor transport system permease protein [Agromyces flavus]GGI47238.1 ABC transporter permease [Agromyces flavus]SDS20094.1 energy-coupling factor transport system permease protein [Agromyces flavus]
MTAHELATTDVQPTLRFVDRVNPVTRLAAAMVLTTPLLLTVDWVSAAIALGIQLVLFAVAGVTPAVLVRRTWPILIAAPVAGLSMLLYGEPSGTVYWELWLARITDGSIELAIAVTVRVLAIGLPAALLFMRVDPTDLADGLAQIARLPARFVLGALAATRLVGLFVEDWRAMSLARRARGIGDHGAIRRAATMAFALLVLAIRRGSKLATAMEARGFGAHAPRTWARPSRVGLVDAVLLVLAAAIAAIAIAGSIWAGTFHPVWA